MLLIIHNLPSNITYSELRGLIKDKCGIQNIIVDNLVGEGKTKKVTVGLADEGDAAILVRKINGLYVGNLQLYVEDVRKKKVSEQPYRNTAQENQDFRNLNQFDNYRETGLNQLGKVYHSVEQGNSRIGYRNEKSNYGNQHSDHQNQASGYVNQNDNRRSSYGNPQPEYGNVFSEVVNQRFEVVNQRAAFGNQHSDYGNKRSEVRNQRSDNGIQPSEYGNQCSEYGNQLSEYGKQPSEYVNQYADYINQRTDYNKDGSADGIRSSDFGNRRSDTGNMRADFVNQQDGYQSGAVFMPQQPYYVAFGQTLAQNPTVMAFSGQTNIAPLMAHPVPSPYEQDTNPPNKGRDDPSSSKKKVPVWDRPSLRASDLNSGSVRGNRPCDFSPATDSQIRRPKSKWDDTNVRPQSQYENERNQYGFSELFDTKNYGVTGANRNDQSSKKNNLRWEPKDNNALNYESLHDNRRDLDGGDRPVRTLNTRNWREKQEQNFGLSEKNVEFRNKRNSMLQNPTFKSPKSSRDFSNSSDTSNKKQTIGIKRKLDDNSFGLAKRSNLNQASSASQNYKLSVKPQLSSAQKTPQYGVSKVGSFDTRNIKASKESTPNALHGSQYKPAPVNFQLKNVPASSKPLTLYQEKTSTPRNESPTQYQAKKKRQRPKKRPLDKRDDHFDPTINKKVRVGSLISRDQTWRSQASSDLSREILKKWCRIEENAIHILRQLKNCIKSRIDILLGERFAVPVPEIIDLYRQKFKHEEDESFYKAVVEKVEASGVKNIITTVQDKESLDKLKKALENNTTAATTKPTPATTKPTPAAPKPYKPNLPFAPVVQIPTGKIPKYPKADKSHFQIQKKITKLEMTGQQTYMLDPPEQKALDEQLTTISNLIKREFENLDGSDKEICKDSKDALAEEFVKTLNLHLTKRILDIRTNLSIMIYGCPKLPRKEDLVRFLNNYGVVSLKKSDKKKMYICSVDSYENYDKLCLTESSIIGDMTVTFKPLYIAGPPVKLKRDDYRKHRADIVKSQLDKINEMFKKKENPNEEQAECTVNNDIGSSNKTNVTSSMTEETNEFNNLLENVNEGVNILEEPTKDTDIPENKIEVTKTNTSISEHALSNPEYATNIDKHELENTEKVSETSKFEVDNSNKLIEKPNDIAVVIENNAVNNAKQNTEKEVQLTSKEGVLSATNNDVRKTTDKDVQSTEKVQETEKDIQSNEKDVALNTKKDFNKTSITIKDKASEKEVLNNDDSEVQMNMKGMTEVDSWGENDDLEGWDLPSNNQLVVGEVVEDDLEDY